jgi:hypothetical protein
MKVVLKSPVLDLEVDDVAKLDDVLAFVEKFLQLQTNYRKAKNKLNRKNRNTPRKKVR